MEIQTGAETHSKSSLWSALHSSYWLVSDPQVGGIEIPNQEIGLSTNEPGQNFVVAKFDGILGLSYPSISAGGETPVMDNMISQNLLNADIFAFYLSRYELTQVP